ncbi:hypothetical protein AB8B24_19465 [Tardiphaga sp. 866_E4_N2_3]
MFSAGASRLRLGPALSEFVRRVKIPFFNTQMGKMLRRSGSRRHSGMGAASVRRRSV